MNQLSELKDLFFKLGLEMRFEGWIIRVGDDRWTMLGGHLYRNGELFDEKKLNEYLKKMKADKPALRKMKAKKIRSKKHVSKGTKAD